MECVGFGKRWEAVAGVRVGELVTEWDYDLRESGGDGSSGWR